MIRTIVFGFMWLFGVIGLFAASIYTLAFMGGIISVVMPIVMVFWLMVGFVYLSK